MVIAASLSSSTLADLGDSIDNIVPIIDDSNGNLYYASSAEILLVAPGGEIVATGTYATDIPAETIESVLP